MAIRMGNAVVRRRLGDKEMMADLELSTPIRTYKFKIEQTAKGARVVVHGDAIDEIVSDYCSLRTKLEQEGFRVAPEE